MKAYNHMYVSLDIFKSFLESINLCLEQKVLLRIHSGIHTADQMQSLASDIKGVLPNAVIIGCSSTHMICEGNIEEHVCLVSISVFEECEVRSKMFTCITAEGKEKDGEVLGEEISRELVKGEKGLMLVFFPGGYYKTDIFVDSMNRTAPELKMIGGKAGEIEKEYQTKEQEAYVLAGTEVSDTGVAAVMISSPDMYLYENVICGVEGVGRSYEITRFKDHALEEIEGMDGAAWYEGMLGAEELVKDPSLSGIFPLVNEETPDIAYYADYRTYHTLPEPWKSKKRNRVSLSVDILEGKKVSLGYFDPQKIVNQMDTTYQKLRKSPVEALFAYDCLARMDMLHDCAKWEVGQFHTTNMSGAMLGGEVGNLRGKNIYANCSFVIAGLSENEGARLYLKGKSLKNASMLQHDNVQMINYLLKTGNKQLSEQVAKQQDKMQKAMFYDASLELENQTKYLFDCDRLKLDKIAVFRIKNEKIIKLFMGQTAFIEELRKTYGKVKAYIKEEKIHFYSYGEYSLLIAAEESVAKEDFVAKMKKIHDCLNGMCYREFIFVYECAVVMQETDALQKAEMALQYGAKEKKQFLLYSDVPEKLLDVKEEMHMLQVLKEALLENRIVPYFQGIYNNRTKCIDMYEALMRVQDAQGNIYYPNQFLQVAKDYNLYEAMSTTMVKKVMELFRDEEVRVTINLNVQDIYDRDMIKIIFRHLKETSHPENFVFELVESEEVQDYQFIKQFADSIHEYGAKIAIDDFGSGFSNLLHIIRIDADILKVDGAIVKEICQDEKCREFVELINDWCSRQNKEVVGEYVENKNIQVQMEEIGIVYSQGFYFAKPQPWEECQKARKN